MRAETTGVRFKTVETEHGPALEWKAGPDAYVQMRLQPDGSIIERVLRRRRKLWHYGKWHATCFLPAVDTEYRELLRKL